MKLTRYSFAILAAIFNAILPIPAAHASRELVLTDESQGCFHHNKIVTVFDKKDSNYVSADGKVLTLDQVKELLAVIEASAASTKLVLSDFGITPENVSKHHDDMVKASVEEDDTLDLLPLAKDSDLYDYERVNRLVEQWATGRIVSTTRGQYTLELNDLTLCPQSIKVSSMQQRPWMLPWSVSTGTRKWKTYSTALSLAISKIADGAGPSFAWLDGRKYWQNDFWKDTDFWYSAAGSQLRDQRAKLIAVQLAGYDAASKLFAIERCSISDVPAFRSTLGIILQPNTPTVISSVSWYTYLDKSKIGAHTQNWSQMIALYEKCSLVASPHKWLTDWRLVGSDRSVQANITGNVCYSDTTQNLNKLVLPTWRAAKMKGAPEIELTLFRKHRFCGTVYLSSADTRALVVAIEPAPGSHWLDKQNISWENPAYLIVQPEGTFEKHILKSK